MTTYGDRRQFAELLELVGSRRIFIVRTEPGQYILREKIFEGSFEDTKAFLERLTRPQEPEPEPGDIPLPSIPALRRVS